MDERHWWIAGKIQESFHIDGYDSPTVLEDFICEPPTLNLIDQFFHPGGPCRLFFYCDKTDMGVVSTGQLRLTSSLATITDINLLDVTVLYFLRHTLDTEVDAGHMEKDIFCGELKGNTIENLNSMLAEIYIPLLRAQKDWGQSTPDSHMVLMHNMDKFLTNLSESTAAQSSKQWMLKQPESLAGTDFKQHRTAALDQHVITAYETLVNEWITTIEAILGDTSDERFMDPNAGPLSELERWRRRQRLLTSITEQLKSKDCKTVIGVLITAKSRLLKKWKLIDSGITDAMNETKDKVRYLESLKRHLDLLYSGATPASIMNTALPGLLQAIKQMDSVSRFYARQGFLGLLFAKITNQLVLACKDYIRQTTMTGDDEDRLWDQVLEEVMQRDGNDRDPHQRHLQAQLETKLRGKTMKGIEGKACKKDGDGLFVRMRACLQLQNFYRDHIRTMRDALGASHGMSHGTSLSSLAPPNSSNTGRNKGPSTSKGSKKSSSLQGDHDGHGVSVADEETILAHMEEFCARIRQVLDVLNTMGQFTKMIGTTSGLPRPRKEDLVCDEIKEKKKKKKQKAASATLR